MSNSTLPSPPVTNPPASAPKRTRMRLVHRIEPASNTYRHDASDRAPLPTPIDQLLRMITQPLPSPAADPLDSSNLLLSLPPTAAAAFRSILGLLDDAQETLALQALAITRLEDTITALYERATCAPPAEPRVLPSLDNPPT